METPLWCGQAIENEYGMCVQGPPESAHFSSIIPFVSVNAFLLP